jgi:hypothetical protein
MNGSLIDLLKDHLKERTKSNPQYSLRAMAKWLHVSPSELSALFTNKRNLTVKMVDHFALPLKLSEAEIRCFKQHAIMEQTARILLKLNLSNDSEVLIEEITLIIKKLGKKYGQLVN